MGTTHELLSRARRGDLDGMCVAGLARLSHEVREDSPEGRELYARMVAEVESARKGRLPFSGADIKGRDEQEKDIRRYVESHGGTYVYTYHEPDTSAWKKRRVRMPDGTVKYRVVRPVFQGMLEDLKRGQAPNGQRLDGIAVVDIDRLTRENRTLEDAIEVVEHYGRPIIDLSGQLDLLTENGRTVARLLVGAKGAESASIARRVERKHRALEQAGIPTGSRRPFGWQEDKRTLNEAEAAELRAAVERLLVGAPMRAILGEWRDRGIVTPAGKTWTYRTLKDKLRDPRICGYRSRKIKEYNPETDRETRRFEIVRDERGKPVIGQWESIISVEQWQAVTDVIGRNADPTRYTGGGFNSRKYLLVGTLRCKCGEKLRASKSGWSKTRKAEGHFTYNCPASSTGRGCGGTRIDGPAPPGISGRRPNGTRNNCRRNGRVRRS